MTEPPHATCAGTPLKPTITAAAGGDTLDASITYAGVFTATTYETILTDVNTPSNTDSDTWTVADTAEGPWTRTLQAPAKGTYRFTVRCGGLVQWCRLDGGPTKHGLPTTQRTHLPHCCAAHRLQRAWRSWPGGPVGACGAGPARCPHPAQWHRRHQPRRWKAGPRLDRTTDQRLHWHQVGGGQWYGRSVPGKAGLPTRLHLHAMPPPPACNFGTPPAPRLRRYTLNLYRPSNHTAPVFTAVLSNTGSTSAGVTTFTQEVQVPAGPYQLEITTSNSNGDGDKTGLGAPFTVGVSTSASIVAGSGSTAGAELSVLRPTNVSDDAVATYLIQAYSDEEGNTKVSGCGLGSAAWGHPRPARWQGRRGGPQWRAEARALPHSMLAVWRGGEGQQHGAWRRRSDAGHGLCLPLPRHRGRQAVVQGHGGGGRHAQ